MRENIFRQFYLPLFIAVMDLTHRHGSSKFQQLTKNVHISEYYMWHAAISRHGNHDNIDAKKKDHTLESRR